MLTEGDRLAAEPVLKMGIARKGVGFDASTFRMSLN
jgi:hypothetical protein